SITLRYQDGLFLPLPGTSFGQAAQEARAGEVFLAILRRYASENRTVFDRAGKGYAPALFAKESEAKKAGLTKKQLEAAMRRGFEAGKIWNEPGPGNRPSRPSYRLALKGWNATGGVHTKDGEPHDDDAPAPQPTAKKAASSVAPIAAWEMDDLKARGFSN